MYSIQTQEIASKSWIWYLYKDNEIILSSRSMYKDKEMAEFFGGLELQSAEIGKPVYGSMGAWLCLECKADCFENNEYYMVHDDIWASALRAKDADVNHHHDGMLCIKCLESRIGRELTAKDFTDAPVNTSKSRTRSELLKKRLKAV